MSNPLPTTTGSLCDGCGEPIKGEPRRIGYHVMHPTDECEHAALHGGDWRCTDCRCINGGHEWCCYRCGAGQPEEGRG